MRYFCARDFTIFHKSSTQILNKIKNDFQPNVLILILTVRFKFRMLWLLALTCQCISHFSLVNGPQRNREMPNKLMIGPDQSLLFNFRRIHLRTRPPAQELPTYYLCDTQKPMEPCENLSNRMIITK